MSKLTDQASEQPAPIPTAAHLLLEAPLYREFRFTDTEETRKRLTALRRNTTQLDAHCIHCGRESVFKAPPMSSGGGAGSSARPVDEAWMLKNGEFSITLHCVRNPLHMYRYYFSVQSGTLRKIGQWPSLEDIAGADIAKYRPLLKGGYFRELKMATGLASHGIGIGAFVYLRRIFERLIYQHHDELPAPVEGFATLRMDEKIDALKTVLPAALVANKGTYAILSKGLHELDEETCKSYFPVVRSAIIRILEQDYQKREADKADQELSKSIGQIVQQLKT
ncbi:MULTISPECIES: hypothetical protein [unclassified Brevundimonas]|jgi:hypothetical protein|uniref:hypothetical protein n=1 Tax=unclassified Brevundimonas TaxID=2622653 RepID=UPI0025B8144D|nr:MULTISPECIES: hypothetical protein [unclassified Brevundimonas]